MEDFDILANDQQIEEMNKAYSQLSNDNLPIIYIEKLENYAVLCQKRIGILKGLSPQLHQSCNRNCADMLKTLYQKNLNICTKLLSVSGTSSVGCISCSGAYLSQLILMQKTALCTIFSINNDINNKYIGKLMSYEYNCQTILNSMLL